jgi:hypothetical protein
LSPLARLFQTMTMAIQRASPIIISPMAKPGLSPKNNTARTNIKIGPTIQFCTKENVNNFLFWVTFPISSYFTLAKGGYIIIIKPMAIGQDMVPVLN